MCIVDQTVTMVDQHCVGLIHVNDMIFTENSTSLHK